MSHTIASQQGAPAPIKPLLAKAYNGQTPVGYWMSEKLDGVRAIWNGQHFLSRNGKIFNAPDWFKQGLPTDQILDGELFIKRDYLQKTAGIIRSKSGDWQPIQFMIFDVINDCPFEERMTQLDQFEAHVLSLKGEGVMLRAPRSQYEHKRSATLMKVKRFQNDEAKIIEIETGKGKYQGKIGALLCQYQDKIIRIGSGIPDALREQSDLIGKSLTFQFFGLTDGGIPRHYE